MKDKETLQVMQVIYDDIYKVIHKIKYDFDKKVTKEDIINELEQVTQRMIDMSR